MEGIKSQTWSNETLVRGMAKVAAQPFDLHALGLANDPELTAEFAVALAVPTSCIFLGLVHTIVFFVT